MSFKTRLTVLLISTPVLAFVIVGGLMSNASARGNDETFVHLRVFDEVIRLVLTNYVEEVNVDRVMEGAMRGLADGLDSDSAYLTPRQVRELEANTPLPDGEVGLQLTRSFGYLRVIASRDGSPAAKAGLTTGDVIRTIDGRSTREMSVFEGQRTLRGEPGSKVALTIIRSNAADPHDVTLVREKPAGAPVSGRMLDAEVGYVRISSFRNGVVEGVRQQTAALAKAGAKSLVLDVRRTAEGTIDNGIAAARLFVDAGTDPDGTLTVKVRREQGQPLQTFTAKPGDGSVDLPVVLLVSTGTSGPAEVFAAALDGNDRGDLVGERTLGRAGEQKLVKLPENRGLWLTHVRYLTPDGEPIHGKGLTPDVSVDDPDVEFGAPAPAVDPILDAAIERIRAKKG